MNGWHGVIVRVVLDNGAPITRINLGGANGFGGDISGAMAQRWTDPNGQENYTQTSPGPLTANNSFDSDFNFDSHLLGTPATYTVQQVSETSNSGFLTSRTPLPSTGFVGYGAAPYMHYEIDPIALGGGSHTGGILDVNPGFQSSTMDIAYVVTDSAFEIQGDVYSGTGSGAHLSAIFEVPEPGSSGVVAIGIAGVISRRRKRQAGGDRPAMETMEQRSYLSRPRPLHPSP